MKRAVACLILSRLDAPYGDTLWGILTGFDAASALAIATTAAPLEVKRVTSGTALAMDRVEQGEWYRELKRHRMVRKQAGGQGLAAGGQLPGGPHRRPRCAGPGLHAFQANHGSPP